jgi:hypothetical protein
VKLRFRLGPFTFGKGGTRLNVWSGGTGVSVPLSKKKGGAFGKVNVGPISAYFNGSSSKLKFSKKSKKVNIIENQELNSTEILAVEELILDQGFMERLVKYGAPWRGVQERIKQELSNNLSNINNVSFKLVPRAMDTIFGHQNTGWKTEKRPAKTGKGKTTWILVIKPDA